MRPQRAIFGALLASKSEEKEGGNPRLFIELFERTRTSSLAAPDARSSASFAYPRNRRGRGKCRVPLHPRSRVQQVRWRTHTSGLQVQPNTRRHSPRNGLRLIRDLLGAPGSLATVALRKRLASLDLSVGRPGPHDFAVRVGCVRLTHQPRPSHPRPTFVTIGRNVPLHRGGMTRRKHEILKNGSKVFYFSGIRTSHTSYSRFRRSWQPTWRIRVDDRVELAHREYDVHLVRELERRGVVEAHVQSSFK